jgi:hypothetical protein
MNLNSAVTTANMPVVNAKSTVRKTFQLTRLCAIIIILRCRDKKNTPWRNIVIFHGIMLPYVQTVPTALVRRPAHTESLSKGSLSWPTKLCPFRQNSRLSFRIFHCSVCYACIFSHSNFCPGKRGFWPQSCRYKAALKDH